MVEKLWICADRKLTLKSHSKIPCFLSGSWCWKHCGSAQTMYIQGVQTKGFFEWTLVVETLSERHVQTKGIPCSLKTEITVKMRYSLQTK